MSDAQLAILLRMILTKLELGINEIENNLPDSFKVVGGGSNVFLDPKTIEFPILNPLYQLERELDLGIIDLTKEKNNG